MILEYLQPKRFEFANLSSSEINEGVTNLEIIEDPRLPKLSEYKVRDIIKPSERTQARKCTHEREIEERELERERERERERELELENDIGLNDLGNERPISSQIENQIDIPAHCNSNSIYIHHGSETERVRIIFCRLGTTDEYGSFTGKGIPR